MTTAETLADVFDQTRDITRYYLSEMKNTDPCKSFELDGMKFNSVYWLCAHLAIAQNRLVLMATGGQPFDIPWYKDYWINSDGLLREDRPDFKAILHLMKDVHARTLQHISSLTDEQLKAENSFKFSTGREPNVYNAIVHAIRHEAMHTGHLSWIAKMNGLKLV